MPKANLWTPLVVPDALNGPTLDRLLAMLTGMGEDFLRANPRTPWLYHAGIRYQMEPPGEEKWLTIPAVLAQGWADCEELGCWRTAELRVRGDVYRDMMGSMVRLPPEDARAFWLRHGRQYHIRVLRADGSVEDPSAVLGMGRETSERFGATHRITNGRRA